MAREPRFSKGNDRATVTVQGVGIQGGNRVLMNRDQVVYTRELAYRKMLAGQSGVKGGQIQFLPDDVSNIQLSEDARIAIRWRADYATTLRWTEEQYGDDVYINVWEPREDGSSIAVDTERARFRVRSEDQLIDLAYDSPEDTQ